MADHRYFANTDCEYFPCHPDADKENFNCLFCYCPLYVLGAECGGDFRILENSIKDCSGCLFPHRRESYDGITARFREICEKMNDGGD